MADNVPDQDQPAEDVPPVGDPLPEDLGFKGVTFEGTELKDPEKFEEDALEAAAKAFERDHGFDPMFWEDAGLLGHRPGGEGNAILHDVWRSYEIAATNAARIAKENEEGEEKAKEPVKLWVNKKGVLQGDPFGDEPPEAQPDPPAAEPEKPNDEELRHQEIRDALQKRQDAGEDLTVEEIDFLLGEREDPPPPPADKKQADPDPFVNSIVEMPAGYWDQRDAASDGVSLFAADLSSALSAEAWGEGHMPCYNGDFIAGKDSNGKLRIDFAMAIDEDFQKDLSGIGLGLCETEFKYLGLAGDKEAKLCVIPIYNEACCNGGSSVEDKCDPTGSGTPTLEPKDLSSFSSGFYGGHSWSLNREIGSSPAFPGNCGFKITFVEHCYVSVGGLSGYDYTLGQHFREARFDNGGALVSISDRKWSIDDTSNVIDTSVVPGSEYDYMWQDQDTTTFVPTSTYNAHISDYNAHTHDVDTTTGSSSEETTAPN